MVAIIVIDEQKKEILQISKKITISFPGVRRVLREVGMRKKDELVADREKMWRAIKQYRGEGINRRRVPVWRWVAAAMLPLLLGGILWINLREKKDLLVAEVMLEIEAGTPRAVLFMEQGERIDLSLLAGDTILNKGDVRIRLDSSKSVTYEQVNTYVSERAIRTTLVSGKVRVGDRLTGKGEVILPGQQVVWKDGVFATKEVDTSIYTAWIDGKFYFEGATLEEITAQLERWYDIDFFFTSDNVKHFAFAGVINKEYSANKIFSIIEKTTQVHFSVNGRVVTVSEINNKQK